MKRFIEEMFLFFVWFGILVVSSIGIASMFDYAMKLVNSNILLAIALFLLCAGLVVLVAYVIFYVYWWSIIYITKRKIDDYNNSRGTTCSDINGNGNNVNNSDTNIGPKKGSNKDD